jgi:uncharacterized protein YndB with AHSA1/START domain
LDRSAEIPAPATQVWALISDWAGMLRWWSDPDQNKAAAARFEAVYAAMFDGYRRYFTPA